MIPFKVAQTARLSLRTRLAIHSTTPAPSRILPTHFLRYASGSSRKGPTTPITPDRLSYTPARSRAARQASPEGDAAKLSRPPVSNSNALSDRHGASRLGATQSSNTAASSREAGEFNPRATPRANTTPNSQPGPPSRKPPVPRDTDAPKEATEFHEGARPERNTVVDAQPGPGSPAGPQDVASSPTPSSAQKPLPDLRFGIPSTFGEEFMKQAQASEASQSATHRDVNITDDPAEPMPGSGRRGGDGESELPRSAFETSIDKRRNRMANIMYLLFAVIGTTSVAYLGRDWENEAEAKQYPEAPSGWSPTLIWARAKARLGGQMAHYTEPTFPKLLPVMDPAPPYTLVLSLEDLMVHSEWSREHGWRTAKRPGIDYFIRYLSQYYELVLFTSMPVTYADAIYAKLDPYRIIQWPLFREATRYEKGQYIKDLSYLNRDLSKVIIMDTKAGHVQAQPENAILLEPWKGSTKDKELVSYIPFLEYIASMGINDVRQALKSYEGTHIPTEYARREAVLREEFNKQIAEQKAKKPRVSGVGFLNSALGIKPQGGGLTMDGQTTVAEGLAEGKMLQDQIRERGMRQYQEMEKQIRENGEMFLKEEAELMKKAAAEQANKIKDWTYGWVGSSSKEGEPSPEKK